MAVEDPADLLDFLELDDFATTATYTPIGGGSTSVVGIFDNPQATRNASDMLGITIPEPRFVCRTTDVSEASEGDALVVDATTYTVRVVLTDGVGMTTLVLEKA